MSDHDDILGFGKLLGTLLQKCMAQYEYILANCNLNWISIKLRYTNITPILY